MTRLFAIAAIVAAQFFTFSIRAGASEPIAERLDGLVAAERDTRLSKPDSDHTDRFRIIERIFYDDFSEEYAYSRLIRNDDD